MELVPASGWADVARTHHLDILELRVEAMEHRLGARMERLLRNHLLVTLGLNLSLLGGILAVVKL